MPASRTSRRRPTQSLPSRTPVPTHLTSGGKSATPPTEFVPFETPGFITEAQWKYICDLMDKKDLFKSPGFFDQVNAMDKEEYATYLANLKETMKRTTRAKASDVIEALKALPYKPREETKSDEPTQTVPQVPAGRYALEHPEDALNPVRFYQVRDGKDNRSKGGKDWTGAKFVERFASDDTFPIKYRSAEYFRVLRDIAANPLAAAQRFGDEWECCSQCGRGLTRRLSRKLRIGPICLSRAGWIADADAYVAAAREELIADGLDPDEKLPRTKQSPSRSRTW